MALPEDIVIGEHRIKAGQSAKVMLPVAKLYTDAEVSLPVFISRSKKVGPTVLICAAVHGDELNLVDDPRTDGSQAVSRQIEENEDADKDGDGESKPAAKRTRAKT